MSVGPCWRPPGMKTCEEGPGAWLHFNRRARARRGCTARTLSPPISRGPRRGRPPEARVSRIHPAIPFVVPPLRHTPAQAPTNLQRYASPGSVWETKSRREPKARFAQNSPTAPLQLAVIWALFPGARRSFVRYFWQGGGSPILIGSLSVKKPRRRAPCFK